MTVRRALFPLALSLLACVGPVGATDSAEPEDDADADTDTDSDTDTDTDTDADSDIVVMETSLGTLRIQLDAENAPITTENFLRYVDEGFFDGDDGEGATTFHRVIPDFMIQGGGITADGVTKSTHEAIELESENGLSNTRGTIAMARTNVADSATSQFFINVVDNDFLDYANTSNPGYAVFGEVLDGMDVADTIVGVDRDGSDKPYEDVEILDCERE